MKSKYVLILSIILFVVAIIIFWKGDNYTIGTALLVIAMLLNLIRQLTHLWNNRRLN